jgi:hypothetical protein
MKNMLNPLNLKAMKTKNIHTTGNSILMVMLILITTAAIGQSRTQRGRADNRGNNRATVHNEATNNNSRPSGNVVRERNNNKPDNNRITYSDRRNDPQPESNNNENHENNSGYKNKKHHDGYDNWNYLHYDHPMTYSNWHFPAPWKYARHARVFRRDCGDYYYYQGNFYRYHPSLGYFIINFPADVIFTFLPAGYEEIYIDGRLYFRYGDIYFEYTPEGYRIIPRPFEVNLTWQF